MVDTTVKEDVKSGDVMCLHEQRVQREQTEQGLVKEEDRQTDTTTASRYNHEYSKQRSIPNLRDNFDRGLPRWLHRVVCPSQRGHDSTALANQVYRVGCTLPMTCPPWVAYRVFVRFLLPYVLDIVDVTFWLAVLLPPLNRFLLGWPRR